jgi:DNA-binding protein HU-beta/integration host factor subunit beta
MPLAGRLQKVKQAVQLVLDGIIEVLVTERRLELRDFGVFEVRVRKARQARNPRTGAVVMVPAKAVVSFKPGRLAAAAILPSAPMPPERLGKGRVNNTMDWL